MSYRGRYNFSRSQDQRDGHRRPPYEEETQPPPKNLPPHKSASQKRRDQKRQDQHREKVGTIEMEKLAKELDKKLCFGFSNMDEAALRQKIEVQKRAVVMPVSTRGIGFYIHSLFIKIHQTYQNVPACSVYEAYRVSLSQVSYRLQVARRDQICNAIIDENLYVRHRLNSDQQESMMGMKINLGPIANIINAIGNQEIMGTSFYFRIPREDIALPHCVTFENLRDTVQALSNPATPQEIRLHFYLNNPLPGARWGPQPRAPRGQRPLLGVEDVNHPQWPILLNPQDFWPDDYGQADFEDDISRLQNLLTWCSRKSVKYYNAESRLEYGAPGVQSALVSNYCMNMRNPSFIYDGHDQVNWNDCSLTAGILNEFWSPETLDNLAAFLGALILVGEIPPGRTDDPYGIRGESRSKIGFSHKWTVLLNNFLA